MGYRHISDSWSDQQPAADGNRLYRVSGNDNSNNTNNDDDGGDNDNDDEKHEAARPITVVPLISPLSLTFKRVLFCLLFSLYRDRPPPSAEPRAFKNVHDSGENFRGVYDDFGRSLRQRQSFSQQHPRGGRGPVHQCSTQLAGVRGESTVANNYYNSNDDVCMMRKTWIYI